MNTKIPVIILIAMSALIVNGQADIMELGEGGVAPVTDVVTPDMSGIFLEVGESINAITEATPFAAIGVCAIQCCGLIPSCWNACMTGLHFFCTSAYYESTMYFLRLSIAALPLMMDYGLSMLVYSTMLGWICPIITIGITAPCCFCCCMPLCFSPCTYLFTIGFVTLTGVVAAFATVYQNYGAHIKEAADDTKGFGGVPSVPTGR